MRVILSSWGIYPFHGMGGQEKHPYYFAQALVKQGVDLEIVCSLDRGGKAREEIYDGLKFVFLPPMCAWRRAVSPWILLFNWNLSRYLRKQQFHVLHSFTDTAYFYLHRRQRAPVILEPFNLEAFQAPSFKDSRLLRKWYQDNLIRRPWRYCLLHADAVAAETEVHRQELADFGINPRRLFLLPQGVDLAQIEQKGKQSPITRDKLGIGPEDPVVLTVFRYSPDTGINYLVDAFPRILEAIPRARLIIVGRRIQPIEVAAHRSIVAQVSALGLGDKVMCLTNVPEAELYGYYRIADVFVSPNVREGHQFVSTQEAMAWSLPLVDTNRGPGVREGENGYIIPKKDPAAIAQGVLRILQGGRGREMGLKSRQIIAEYDMSHVAQLAVAQYQKMLDGQG